MTLRPIKTEDAPACAAILREWIDGTPWFPSLHPPSADQGFLERRIAAGGGAVAETDGILGFIAWEDQYVSCLYVRAAARGAGVGAALLSAAKAASDTLRLWTFVANEGAQRFYLREGFRELQRTDGQDNEERMPDIEFGWERGA